MKKILLVLGGAVLFFTGHASAVSFRDDTFNLANYSETPVFTTSASDTVSWMQCSTCGNPGQALQILMNLPTANDLAAVGFINNTFAYNPLTQGAIGTINASVDKNIITNVPVDPSTTFSNTFRPLIEQDGLFYLAAIHGPAFNGGSTGYNTISQTGLMASDFTQFDFSTGIFGNQHPNFAGDPMLFGLAQITQFGVANLNFEADYDNLNISVPESGDTIILLLLGLVATFLVGPLLYEGTRPKSGSKTILKTSANWPQKVRFFLKPRTFESFSHK